MKTRTLLIALSVIFSVSVLSNAQDLLKKPTSISGQVLDENNRPLEGARVEARPDYLRGMLPMAVSDSQGKFAIEVYRSGRYRITASKTADGYGSMAARFHYPSIDWVPQVVVNPDLPTPFVTVKLGPRAGTLTGRVVDESNLPVQRVSIGVCRVASPRFCRREELSNMAQFHILVPSVPVVVEISAEGYRDWFGPVNANNLLSPLTVASNSRQELSITLVRSSKSDDSTNALEAPQNLSPEDGSEFWHFPRKTRLEWAQVAGARSYSVEIQFCSKSETKECNAPNDFAGTTPAAGIEVTSYEFEFLGNQPGRWRVWGNDENGKPGKKSPWWLFIYRP